MSRRRPKHYGRYIFAKNKLWIMWPVEQKNEMHFGMLLRNAFEGLIAEPSHAIEAAWKKQTGIYDYLQFNLL